MNKIFMTFYIKCIKKHNNNTYTINKVIRRKKFITFHKKNLNFDFEITVTTTNVPLKKTSSFGN